LSLRLYSQTPMLFLVLCLTWAWPAWRRDRRPFRAAIIGVIAGWMLIVRPLDAIVFVIPVAVAMAFDLRKLERRTLAAVAIGVLPLVSLQFIANRGITGSWLTTPHGFYADRDFPGVTLGFHAPRPMSMLVTTVPQKRELYRDTIPAIEHHQPTNVITEMIRNRLPLTIAATLPNNLLIILLPLGVGALLVYPRNEHRWVLAAPLLLFVLAYAFYLFYFAHYLLVIAPSMILLIVLAARKLPTLWPQAQHALSVFFALSMVALSMYALPEFDRIVHDDVGAGDLGALNKLLAGLEHRPAIVLFRYTDGVSVHREPVYNTDTRSIDDADVIRAHDLPGEANRKLLEYYAAHQPQRRLYRIIRSANGPPQLHDLGQVGQAARGPL